MGKYLNTDGALAFLVRSAWLGMRAAIGTELEEFGLSTPQYATLMIVQDHPGLSNADIARKVSSSRQSANEMLSGLERNGLIQRLPHPGDRRTQQIQITEAGRALLERARIAVTRREAELESGLDEQQRAAFRAWLEGIAEACVPDDG
ncbi:MarR family winged helix-turn-helix transcriptional regulator [Actinomadura macra]|uniref:MarR family winged helix-turn-helix transcriptional regulator n=1 Tax=Actinomadura macra TaxID=46164 RepID=UPI000829B0A9|nr:MarR family transcriptional regulator [Actinomadura macra]